MTLAPHLDLPVWSCAHHAKVRGLTPPSRGWEALSCGLAGNGDVSPKLDHPQAWRCEGTAPPRWVLGLEGIDIMCN